MSHAIAEMVDAEATDIEAEIRARHRPVTHASEPCPFGGCCACGAVGGCDTGLVLAILDAERRRARQEEPR